MKLPPHLLRHEWVFPGIVVIVIQDISQGDILSITTQKYEVY